MSRGRGTNDTITREEYWRLREERENFPGIVVVDGHVVSDRFGETYAGRAMTDDELPEALRRKGRTEP